MSTSSADPNQQATTCPNCSLCLHLPADADSHIIPAALHRDLKSDPEETLYRIPADPAEREKRNRTGAKQTGILCGPCEKRFQVYDTWMIEALRTEPVRMAGAANQHLRHLAGADAGRLKLGVMHMLWRAHASSFPEFQSARLLNTQAARLRALLLADEPGNEIDFGVILNLYAEDHDGLHKTIGPSTPFRWKTNRARGVEFHLARWRVTVTCSQSGIPNPWRGISLLPGRPVAVLYSADYRKSPNFRNSIESGRARGWGTDSAEQA